MEVVLLCGHQGWKPSIREVYYSDTELFGRQGTVSRTVQVITSTLKLPRQAIGIESVSKGWVFGELFATTIDENGNESVLWDCRQQCLSACWNQLVGNTLHCPLVLIVVEKEATFQVLVQHFQELKRLIPKVCIATGKGYPCYQTMRFVSEISARASQSMVFVDYDPYGLSIAMQYKFGCKSEVDRVTSPFLCLAGVFRHQVDFYVKLGNSSSRTLMGKRERAVLKNLMKRSQNDWPELHQSAWEMMEAGFCMEMEKLYESDPLVLIDIFAKRHLMLTKSV